MNITELQHALHQLRLGGMARTLETRLRQAQAEPMAPIDLLSCLISDELTTRGDRLLERRRKQAAFRDPHRTLDNFDFSFNPKMNRSLIFELATAALSPNMKTHSSSDQAAPARVIWHKRSDRRSSCKVIACIIAKRMSCSTILPMRPPPARANSS